MNGTDILLLVNTGTEQSPSWTAVGSQRDVTFDETNDEIDVSSKNSRRYRVLAGRYTAKLSLDALYVPDDTAYQALKAAQRAGDLIKVRSEEEGTAIEEADALITSMSKKAPDQNAATISIDMTLDDGWSVVGS